MRIDSHQHFWKYNEPEYEWIKPHMQILKRDYLPADLKIELGKSGYEGCVAVQARQCDAETSFLLDLMEANSFIKGIVGWVDLQAVNVAGKLERYANNSGLKGLRHIVESEADPQFLLRPAFLDGIRLLKKYRLTYDILIKPDRLSSAAEFVSKFPDQKFAVDHLAKPYIKEKKLLPWKRDLEALSAFPNVYCKLSGMVTEASWKTWSKKDFTPYMEVALEAFGSRRLMIGSDWPVCLLSATYEQVMGIAGDYISRLSNDEQKRITGVNACDFYNL